MSNFNKVKEALEFIDEHLDEQITLETIAKHFNFSAYYFHRLFSLIVGKTIAVYISERRMLRACIQLSTTDQSIIDIGFGCGYNSAQSFSRAFKHFNGLSPREYRCQGLSPVVVTVEEMIMRFTNRLKGGIYLNPRIIKCGELIIAGVSGDGNKTGEVWGAFEKLSKVSPINKKLSENGYEVRLYTDDTCKVHVGFAVSDENAGSGYEVIKLPASNYASFEVYVANGYESENNAMNEWLKTNQEGYTEKLLNTSHYCVEYYDERFSGSESGSIVEIWIPIEKTKQNI